MQILLLEYKSEADDIDVECDTESTSPTGITNSYESHSGSLPDDISTHKDEHPAQPIIKSLKPQFIVSKSGHLMLRGINVINGL